MAELDGRDAFARKRLLDALKSDATDVAALIDAQLDHHRITDPDLRANVHARGTVWTAWLCSPAIDDAEAALPCCKPAIKPGAPAADWPQLRAQILRELIALAVGQAVLEQRARRLGLTLVG